MKFTVEVLRPGVTEGVSQIEREYSEEALREALESLENVPVTTGTERLEPRDTVGRVVDYEYDNGIVATVEIEDEDVIEQIETGLGSLAPSLILDSDNPHEATDIEFRSLFLAPEVSKLVGSTERAE